jgi:hypothetical protein
MVDEKMMRKIMDFGILFWNSLLKKENVYVLN